MMGAIMSKIDSYWMDDDQPGVLVEKDSETFKGFLINEGQDQWTPVTEYDVVQWFRSGNELSKAQFESTFGRIGSELPQLPQA